MESLPDCPSAWPPAGIFPDWRSTPVETSPGYTVISGHTIRDHSNYGLLDVTGVLTKSSNVGVTKLALQLEPEQMWDTYRRYGFGEATGTGFPGESAGVLRNHERWRRLEQATIAVIAFQAYKHPEQTMAHDLTVHSLAATIESLRRASFGRVVVSLLTVTDFIEQAALDPYAFERDSWLQKRAFDISDGSFEDEDF